MPRDADAQAKALNAALKGADAQRIMNILLSDPRLGRIALVSSFGAESVVLLHMASKVSRSVPVLFLETGMLFAETLDYQREVAAALGLTDIRLIRPPADVDEDGTLHRRDPDGCCSIRKTLPLQRALEGFDGWITGRKRHQSGTRTALPLFEAENGGLKANPLAGWSGRELSAYMDRHALPRHPLVAKGYPSLGCAPCTTRVREGEDARAGRWRGTGKVECGIHFIGGKMVRQQPEDAA